MRVGTLILVLLFPFAGNTQFSVHIRVTNTIKSADAGPVLFLAGSFNNWNPSDSNYSMFQQAGEAWGADLQLEKGMYEYKITRGDWAKVECKQDGSDMSNRILDIRGDTVVTITIEGWKDAFAKKSVVSTASKNVRMIDTAFVIPQLNRTRRIWIYLPEGYERSATTRYPVLYMQDGQNVFDAATAYSGEWGVDECMDASSQPAIVVAIDHGGGKRINEYNPYDNERFGKGEGDQYVRFLTQTLKPFIDRHYRTLKDKKHTFIAGSSMGGLIAMYALLKYPDVFGGAGVFSPSFWITGSGISDAVKANAGNVHARIYFYCGKMEGSKMAEDTEYIYNEMKKVSLSELKLVLSDTGKHNEETWRKEFPGFYEWIMK